MIRRAGRAALAYCLAVTLAFAQTAQGPAPFAPSNPANLGPTAYRVVANLKGTQPETLGANIAGTSYTRLDGRRLCQSARVAAYNVQVVFNGQQVAQNTGSLTTAAGDTGNPNDIWLQLALEVGGVNQGLLTWNGVQPFNIPAGFPNAMTDPTGYLLPAATSFYLRFSESIDSTAKAMTRPYNAGPSNYQFQVSYSNNASGQASGTGSLTVANASSTAWEPIAIIGVPQGPMTAVGVIGMSISGGTLDTNPDAYGGYGWIGKGVNAVSPNIPVLSLSRGSSETIDYLNAAGTRLALLPYVDVVIYDEATNDIAVGGATLAQLQTNAQQIWKQIRAAGKKLYAVTVMPRTTSTNSWATAAAQTPVTGFTEGGIRDQYNSWLYTELQAGVIDGLVDPALGRYAIGTAAVWVNTSGGGVEDPANLSKWITTNGAATTDGTHPSSSTGTNAVAIAAATLTAFVTAMGW